MAKKSKGDACYFLPKKDGAMAKKPFAYSPSSTLFLFEIFAGQGLTIQQAYNECHYGIDEKNILQVYIDKGYGDTPMTRFFNVR